MVTGLLGAECLFLLSIHFPFVKNILLPFGKLRIPLLCLHDSESR